MGGMENPLLTFVSPTIIVGDKSEVSVANHEIAHSWAGNYVTNMNWDNFWLNEGFTVFLERKLDSMISGSIFTKISSQNGNSSMYEAMLGWGLNNTFSSLTPRAGTQRDPYDAFSSVPYEKGYQFLLYLESLDGELNFKKFMQTYFKKWAYQSINVNDMRSTFELHLNEVWSSSKAKDIMKQIDWNTWLLTGGLPPVTANFTTQEAKNATALADAYIANGGSTSPSGYEKFHTWFSSLQQSFIYRLLENQSKVTITILTKIDKDLNLSHMKNPAIRSLWD